MATFTSTDERNIPWPLEPVTLPLNATLRDFQEQLQEYVLDHATDRYPSEVGQLHVGGYSVEKSIAGHSRVIWLDADYWRPLREGEQPLHGLPPNGTERVGENLAQIISLNVARPSDGRLAVTAECHNPDVRAYFVHLIDRIGEIWSEAAQDATEYLDKLRFEAGQAPVQRLQSWVRTLPVVTEALAVPVDDTTPKAFAQWLQGQVPPERLDPRPLADGCHLRLLPWERSPVEKARDGSLMHADALLVIPGGQELPETLPDGLVLPDTTGFPHFTGPEWRSGTRRFIIQPAMHFWAKPGLNDRQVQLWARCYLAPYQGTFGFILRQLAMLQPGIRDRVEAYLSGSLSQRENTTQAKAAPAIDRYLGREGGEVGLAVATGLSLQSEPEGVPDQSGAAPSATPTRGGRKRISALAGKGPAELQAVFEELWLLNATTDVGANRTSPRPTMADMAEYYGVGESAFYHHKGTWVPPWVPEPPEAATLRARIDEL